MDILALLFPREKKFYKMVEEQVTLVGEAVSDFDLLISQYNKLTPLKKKKLAEEICKVENKDDVLYTKMVVALKSTFITPMDREDIHRLVVTFDNIIDTLELLTLKLSAFDIKKTDKYLLDQVNILNKSYRLVKKIIFSIKDETQVEKYCLEIRNLEQKGDKVFIQALGKLFSESYTPVDIIKYKDLYTSIERMIDQLNSVALIIENLVVKYS